MKRVAICFWGQTRTFRNLKNTFHQLQSKDIQFDFFISTWDDFKDKSPFDFCTKKEFVEPDIRKETGDSYFKDHTDRASYLIHRVNLLKTQHELENNFIYDYVMWTRSEIFFDPYQLSKLIEAKTNNHTDYELNIGYPTHIDDDGFEYAPTDYYFLGTSLSFDLYATGWKSYYKRNDMPFSYGRHGGHNYHAWVIKKYPFDVEVVKIHHEFLFGKVQKREVE